MKENVEITTADSVQKPPEFFPNVACAYGNKN